MQESLAAAFPGLDFDFACADTSSSFESFRLVCLRLAQRHDSFLVSTTDALVPPAQVLAFWEECLRSGAPAGLALTRFVDDEKPLWADADADGRLAALGEDAVRRQAATCGLYFMTRRACRRLPGPGEHARLRDWWTGLARGGLEIRAPLLGKTLDVDRPEDLSAAETFLRTEMA